MACDKNAILRVFSVHKSSPDQIEQHVVWYPIATSELAPLSAWLFPSVSNQQDESPDADTDHTQAKFPEARVYVQERQRQRTPTKHDGACVEPEGFEHLIAFMPSRNAVFFNGAYYEHVESS